MGKKQIDTLYEKLDKIYDVSMNNSGDLKAVKEHLKTLNGKVIRNMKEIEKVRTEADCKRLGCEKHFKMVEEKIEKNQDSIIFAKGTVYAVSILTALIGLFGATKLIGLW